MDQLPAFEVRALDESGGFRDSVVLGRVSELEASAIAQDYANLWGRRTALTIVPGVDDGSSHIDWDEHQIQVVKELHSRPVRPAERQAILRRCYGWQTDEQFADMQSKTASIESDRFAIPELGYADGFDDDLPF